VLAKRFGLSRSTVGVIRAFKTDEEQRAYHSAYVKTPRWRAYYRTYKKTPKWRAYYRARNRNPKRRAWNRARRKTPRIRAYFRAYNKSPKMRAWNRAWLKTPRGRANTAIHGLRRRARKVGAYCGCIRADSIASWSRGKSLPCYYCGEIRLATIDHILPLARGGKHRIGNIQICCRACNSGKKDRTDAEFVAFRRAQGLRVARDASAKRIFNSWWKSNTRKQ
jgi:5-methylcytosine-specific restriction endonuclease McrA